MNNLAPWESIVLVLIMAGLILWFFPGIRRANQANKNAPKDWAGLILPLIAVVVFVLLLTQLI